jgi:hypothetical protein
MDAALHDQALVVRAEAATRIGRKFEATQNRAVIDLLAGSYRQPRNTRHGKPLFIQQRILFAIHRIGGSEAEKMGLRLAESHPVSLAYWNKLTGSKQP